MTKSRLLMLVVVILAVVTVAGGIGWKLYGDPHENSGHLILLGNVDVRQVTLAFKVPGRVAAVNAEEGDTVERGQVVASLEEEDFEDELRLTQAHAKAQEAVLAQLEKGTRTEEIEQARALVKQRQAALKLARSTLKRQEELASRNIASHQVHDEAQANVDEAAALLRAAEQALEKAEAGPRQEDIMRARAELSAGVAASSLAERRLADATLYAPNDGVILTRVREPGAIIAAGEPVYTLSLNSPIWVRTYVNEPDLGRIHSGMAAEVQTDAGGIYEGQIGFISPVAEFTPKTVETRELRTSLVYRLRVIVGNPDNSLKQGMPVTVVLRPEEEG